MGKKQKQGLTRSYNKNGISFETHTGTYHIHEVLNCRRLLRQQQQQQQQGERQTTEIVPTIQGIGTSAIDQSQAHVDMGQCDRPTTDTQRIRDSAIDQSQACRGYRDSAIHQTTSTKGDRGQLLCMADHTGLQRRQGTASMANHKNAGDSALTAYRWLKVKLNRGQSA